MSDEKPVKMIEKREWAEFHKCGMVWFVNRILHLFGWAIVISMDKDTGVVDAYPARCHFRGFPEDTEAAGYEKVTQYMKDHVDEFIEDVKS